MPDFVVVIPARFASTRLPGKPLADIAGKPMVVHVAERGRESGAAEIIVATDDARIEDAVRRHGHVAMMTRPDHASGTDRLAEVVAARGWDDQRIVLNVQGDEPRIPPSLIASLADQLQRHPESDIATACHPIHSVAEALDPNVVKVVMDRHGQAIYFSRAPIPYARDAFARSPPRLPEGLPIFRHLGIYAYRCRFLKTYARLDVAKLEQFEALEQLRALWHGFRIRVAITEAAPDPGVDTPADLENMRQAFSQGAPLPL